MKALRISFEPTRAAIFALLAVSASWAAASCSGEPTCQESGTCASPTTDDGGSGGGGGGSRDGGGGGGDHEAGPSDSGVASFEMTVTLAPSVTVGTSVDLEVTIAREGPRGVAGRVSVDLVPETGISATPVVVEADASTAKMKVTVSADRRHGTVPLVVRGTAEESGLEGEASVSTLVRGTPGSIDTSFGVDGTFTFDKADSEATGVVVQSDGKIVLAGRAGEDLAIVQLLEDGTVDTSFNGGATTIKPPGNGVLSTTNLVADKNGALVVAMLVSKAGSSPFAQALRLTRSGALDATFGTGGTGTVGLDFSEPTSLAVGSDGSIFVGGGQLYFDGQYVIKLKPNGGLDTGWGSAGVWSDSASGSCLGGPLECQTRAIAIEPSGTLLACQPRNDGSRIHRVAINGVTGNLHEITSLTLGECRSVAPDLSTPGFAFMGGNSDQSPTPTLAVRRIPPNGVDPGTWGNAGSQFDAPEESGLRFARALASVEGKLLIGAEAVVGGVAAFGVARLTSLGALDTTFAEKGYVTFKVDGKASTLKAMAIDALGRIIVAGTNGKMVAVRLWP